MRQDIQEYLHEQGWTYSHKTEDGRRIWSQDTVDAAHRATITRFDEEDHLVDLALNLL